MQVVVTMPFLSLSNLDQQSDTKKLTCRLYTTVEVLFIAKRVELINQHELAEKTLDKNANTFIVYHAALKASKLATLIYPLRTPLSAALQEKET